MFCAKSLARKYRWQYHLLRCCPVRSKNTFFDPIANLRYDHQKKRKLRKEPLTKICRNLKVILQRLQYLRPLSCTQILFADPVRRPWSNPLRVDQKVHKALERLFDPALEVALAFRRRGFKGEAGLVDPVCLGLCKPTSPYTRL